MRSPSERTAPAESWAEEEREGEEEGGADASSTVLDLTKRRREPKKERSFCSANSARAWESCSRNFSHSGEDETPFSWG